MLDSIYGDYTMGSNTARLALDRTQAVQVSQLTGEALYDRASHLALEPRHLGEAGKRALARLAAACTGQLQIEAEIQSAHWQRMTGGATPWPAIVHVYGALAKVSPSSGALTGHALALPEAGEGNAGLAMPDGLPPETTRSCQPYRVARAHVERLLSRAK